jgi:hypothetical protein
MGVGLWRKMLESGVLANQKLPKHEYEFYGGKDDDSLKHYL